MMPDQEQMVPDLIGTGVEATVKLANQLGLTWRLRLATVLEVRDVNLMLVKIDGDDAPILVTSMIGLGHFNQRVYVISVPPAGNYVAGIANSFLPGQRIATTVRTTNSSGFTAETVTDTVTGNLVGNRTYKVTAQLLAQSTVANDTENVRIREDSISGTQLQVSRVIMPAAGAGFFVHLEVEFTPVASITKTFALTGVRVAGTGTITHAAATSSPTYFYIDYARG